MHNGELTQFQDKIVKYSSIKIVHGICREERLFKDKNKILGLVLKMFCKTPNESVVECIGSIAELDWNGPIIHKAQSFLEKSLDRHFGSRKKWRFHTGSTSTKFGVSKVVDRIHNEPSRLSFME